MKMETLTVCARAAFFDFPLLAAKGVLAAFGRNKEGKRVFYIWLGCAFLSAVIYFVIKWLAAAGILSGWWQINKNILPMMAAFYCVYILMMLPILIPYQYAKEAKFSSWRSKEKRFKSRPKDMFKARSQSKPSMVFLGRSMKSKKPLWCRLWE